MRPVSAEAIGVHRQMAAIDIGKTWRKAVDTANCPDEADEQTIVVPMTRRPHVRVKVMAYLRAENRAVELGVRRAVQAAYRMSASYASPHGRQRAGLGG